MKIPTAGGKTKWTGSNIKYILTNVRYKGDALYRKNIIQIFRLKVK